MPLWNSQRGNWNTAKNVIVFIFKRKCNNHLFKKVYINQIISHRAYYHICVNTCITNVIKKLSIYFEHRWRCIEHEWARKPGLRDNR